MSFLSKPMPRREVPVTLVQLLNHFGEEEVLRAAWNSMVMRTQILACMEHKSELDSESDCFARRHKRREINEQAVNNLIKEIRGDE